MTQTELDHNQRPTASGITLKSVAASLFAVFLTAIATQYATLIVASDDQFGVLGLPLAALGVMFSILLACAVVRVYAKACLFSKQELLVIFYSALIAAPLASGALWRPLLPLIATIPRSGEFKLLDSIHPSLWPHGEDLGTGMLSPGSPALLDPGSLHWALTPGSPPALLLENDGHGSARLAFRFPLSAPTETGLRGSTRYLFSIEAKVEGLGGNSSLVGYLYYDDSDIFAEELFITREKSEPNYLRPDGFATLGKYGVSIPAKVRENIRLEFSLQGTGRVYLRNLKIYSVDALETAFTGRQVLDAKSFAALQPEDRAGVISKPDSWLSTDALKYYAAGYVPLREWSKPLLLWGGYVFLLFTAVYAVLIIMRRQWFDRERYAMPLGRIASWVLGYEHDTAMTVAPSIWKSPYFRIAFAVSLAYALLIGISAYNPRIPELQINILLKPYFDSPSFGEMWTGVAFTVSLVLLGLALFMEINVLVSIVVGYFFYRSSYWFGESFGFSVNPAFPYVWNQMTGAYLGYGLLILVLSRKYLSHYLRSALVNRPCDSGECLSPRSTLLLLGLSLSGIYLWSRYLNFPLTGVFMGFTVLFLISFTMAKFRAEIGLPISVLLSLSCVPGILMFNAIPLFGGEGLLFFVFLSIIVCHNYLLVTPGFQLEFTELGLRYGIPGRQVFIAGMVAVGGGLAIGAWAFLSTVYGNGIDNLPATQDMSKDWPRTLSTYREAVNAASQATDSGKAFWSVEHSAFTFGAGAVVLSGILRQMFAGFWFHPAGFILGPTMLGTYWGTLLTAAAIRFVVLRTGGAVVIREKLLPAAFGIFLGAVAAHFIYFTTDFALFQLNPSEFISRDLFSEISRLF